MSNTAYIYDAIRTPRGKGKSDGSLHQVAPIWLIRELLTNLQSRNQLDTQLVDDVVLGCVTPVGEQGSDLARIATLEGFSRSDGDAYATESHRRAQQASEQGYFAKSIIPVKDINGLMILDRDETIRADTSVERLAELKPSFAMPGKMGFDKVVLDKYATIEKINHVHHAGNSSGIVDGAALCLLGSQSAGQAANLKPRAKVTMAAVVGSEPTIMLTGPTLAARKALARANMQVSDIDLWEINEAFAAVPMK
ncbi:acetyl-CoA C-acyltransferase, partial [Xanthomonas citri pv. citri]